MVAAFTAWIDALARALAVPAPMLGPCNWKHGRLSTKLDGKLVVLPLSAPTTVVASLWVNHALASAREQPAGAWNAIVTLCRCDGDSHVRYLALVAAIHASGSTHEARLAWMQARTIQDEDDRADGLFVPIFGKVPRAALIDSARSSAALLERLLPFAKSKSAVDRMIAAEAIGEHCSQACLEVSGARRTRLIRNVDQAITTLTLDGEPCIVDTMRLARQTWSRTLAYAF